MIDEGNWMRGSSRLRTSSAAVGGVAHSKEESEPVDDDAYGVEAVDEEVDSASEVARMLFGCEISLVVLEDAMEERTVVDWAEREAVTAGGASSEVGSTSMSMSRPSNKEMAAEREGFDSSPAECRRSRGRGEGRVKGEYPRPTEATMAVPERCGVDIHAPCTIFDASERVLEGVVEVYGAGRRAKRAVADLLSASNAWWRWARWEGRATFACEFMLWNEKTFGARRPAGWCWKAWGWREEEQAGGGCEQR